MKLLFTSLFCFLVSLSFAQPSSEMTKDTVQANLYIRQAKTLIANQGHFDEAMQLLEQADSLYKNHAFQPTRLHIKSLMAFNLSATKNLKKVEAMADQAFALAKANNINATFPPLKYAYWALQNAYLNQDYQRSVEFGKKALAGFAPTSSEYFQIAESIMRNYAYTRDLNALKSFIEELETILKDQPQSANWLTIYRGKVQYFTISDNYEKAIVFALKLFSENKKIERYQPHQLAPMYVELGNAYASLGQFDEAIAWMQKGIKTSEKRQNDPILGTYYGNLGTLYYKKRDWKQAAKNYEQAAQLLLKDTINYAQPLKIIYVNLGAVYYNLSDYKQAEKNIKAARQYGSNSHGADLNYANILGAQKKYAQALELLQLALTKICTHFNDKKDYTTNPSEFEVYKDINSAGSILLSKGVYLFRLGKEQNDIALMKAGRQTQALAITVYQKKLENSKGYEATKFTINKAAISALSFMAITQYEIYQTASSKAELEVFFKISEQRKAMQLLETLTPSPLPKALSDEEKAIIRTIQYNGQGLDLATYRQEQDSIQYFQNQLFEANQRLENWQNKVKVEYPNLANNIAYTQYAKIGDIQATLDEKTIFVAYTYFSPYCFINTITKNGTQLYQVNATDINKNINRLNELIKDRFAFQKATREEFIDISHELYKILIAPIAGELQGKTKLMIVQEGQLFSLPFEVLLASNDKKSYSELDYLIKQFDINYHYSASAYLQLQSKPSIRDNSLLAFAPVFKKGANLNSPTRSLDFIVDSLYHSFRNNRFITLPDTEKEVNAIAKMLKGKGKTKVLLQRKATKNNLSKAISKQQYQFVHIATHGIVNFKNPKLSALACYSANDKNDNLYYANEIQNQAIQADLVVLSSCESGIGQLIEGEGLIALNRSFFYSGAKNVLFSLWKVNDRLSSDLMIDFYKNYLAGNSYTAALRNAKLKMLANSETAEPKFWAAFVLMGE